MEDLPKCAFKLGSDGKLATITTEHKLEDIQLILVDKEGVSAKLGVQLSTDRFIVKIKGKHPVLAKRVEFQIFNYIDNITQPMVKITNYILNDPQTIDEYNYDILGNQTHLGIYYAADLDPDKTKPIERN